MQSDEHDTADAVAAQNGDGAARERVVRRYLPVARRISARLEVASIDDTTQAAMLALLLAISNFDPEQDKPFRSYAHSAMRWAIVRNACEDARGSEVSLDQVLEDGLSRHETLADTDSPDPEDWAIAREAIGRLPPRSRRVVQGILSGKLEREIANDLGVTQQQISKLHRRAMAELAR